ncbi:MAG: preprotein translocase subunit YajC [Saprospiraceae bacterium]|nr:preprotein translocase subunit YajC [Saprospiraceae bacterium]
MINLLFLGLFLAIFYLFFMRPNIRKQKAQDQFIKDLSKGDQVVTSSGIIGKITKVEDNSIELQVDNKSFIKVLKSAVSRENTEAIFSSKDD